MHALEYKDVPSHTHRGWNCLPSLQRHTEPLYWAHTTYMPVPSLIGWFTGCGKSVADPGFGQGRGQEFFFQDFADVAR